MVGGIVNESKIVTSDYTVVEQDEIVYVDTTSNSVTLTLETPTNDNIVHIKHVAGDNALTLSASRTIDGANSYDVKGSVTLAYFIDGSVSEFKTISHGKPYKVYSALLTQTSTNPPTATVLENELGGDVVWGYSSTGTYTATLVGAFTEDKTILLGSSVAQDTIFSMIRVDDDVVRIRTYDTGSVSFFDGRLSNSTFEIRVYN